ncbi:DUF4279 domain-containing protein [Paenibacillus sp. FSL R10-2736]|uniref:DUF4279 domain-containing protein n=1 Tax=Paenibacillus sp. FSL R10-2736 TaxID=2954692 RepID=UPI0030F59096
MNGSCSFIIRNEALDFDYITRRLAIRPTSILKKGQDIRKGAVTQAPFDIWRYDVIISEEFEPDEALQLLLNDLTPNFKEINELTGLYKDVGIDCYLRSDYGQMGLQLTTEMIKEISILGLGVNIHILSFGGVEEDD